MSWLFGAIQKQNKSCFNFSLNEDFQKVENCNLLVAVSDNSKTAFIKTTSTGITACVGVPILVILSLFF